MAKSGPEYCRNPQELAAALGYTIPKQRNKLARLVAQMRAWADNTGLPKGCPPFPEKVPGRGYWPRKAVAKLAKWLGPEAQKPSKTEPLSAEAQAMPESVPGDLPVQADPATGELFESKEQQFQRRLDFLEDLYLNAAQHPERKITKFEIDELKTHRPEIWQINPAAGVGESGKQIGGGVRGVANFIRNNFPWVSCDHMTVQRWKRGEFLPPGCKANFPTTDDGGRWDKAAVEEWVKTHLPPAPVGQSLGINIVAEREREEREQIEHNRWLREMERAATDKNYILVDRLLDYGGEVGRAVFRAPYRMEKEQLRLFLEHPAHADLSPAQRTRLEEAMKELLPRFSALICATMQQDIEAILKQTSEDADE